MKVTDGIDNKNHESYYESLKSWKQELDLRGNLATTTTTTNEFIKCIKHLFTWKFKIRIRNEYKFCMKKHCKIIMIFMMLLTVA